jgi:hypothetical protein
MRLFIAAGLTPLSIYKYTHIYIYIYINHIDTNTHIQI